MKAVWAVVLVIALAGCTAPEEKDEVDLWQPCPQWLPGEATVLDANVSGETDVPVADVPAMQDGRALDLFVLTFTVNGSVSLRAESGGLRLLLDTDTASDLPSLDLAGGEVARVFLSAVEQGSTPASEPLHLVFDGEGAVHVTAEPYYRVCGVPST